MTNVLYDVPGPKARLRSRIVSAVGIVAIAIGLAALGWALAAPRITAAGVELPGMFDPSRWDILNDRAVWRRIGIGLLNTLQMAGAAAIGAVADDVLGLRAVRVDDAAAAYVKGSLRMVKVLRNLVHDPLVDGGPDGLDAYRAILAGIGDHLAAGGLLAVEIGWDQGDAVAALFRTAGLMEIEVHRDLGGRERVVSGRRSMQFD